MKISLTILIFAAIGLLAGCGAADFSKDNAFDYLSENDDRARRALLEIEDELLSPSTTKIVSAQLRTDEGKSLVKIKLDCQNKYGATVRSEWGIKLHWYNYQKTNGWWSADSCVVLSDPGHIRK